VGLLTQRGLLRKLSTSKESSDGGEPLSVRDVMVSNPVTVAPGDTTIAAIEVMREHRIGCLPVVDHGRLVGLVTEHDFIDAAANLLEETLRSR
jgi:CBS domain-containing protein